MATIRRFEDIKAWQAAREIVRDVYALVYGTKVARDFGLRDQMTRAAVSVMSNIAEGFGRHSARDFARFLDLSRASAIEVQSLLYVASDVGYVDAQRAAALRQRLDECIAMIAGFQRYLRAPPELQTPEPPTPNSKLQTPNSELQTPNSEL